MRVRDQRPIIVDQQNIRPPDARRRQSDNNEPNARDVGLRSMGTNQVSAQNETAAPTTSAPLVRSDFPISGKHSIAVEDAIEMATLKRLLLPAFGASGQCGQTVGQSLDELFDALGLGRLRRGRFDPRVHAIGSVFHRVKRSYRWNVKPGVIACPGPPFHIGGRTPQPLRGLGGLDDRVRRWLQLFGCTRCQHGVADYLGALFSWIDGLAVGHPAGFEDVRQGLAAESLVGCLDGGQVGYPGNTVTLGVGPIPALYRRCRGFRRRGRFDYGHRCGFLGGLGLRR